MGEKYPWASPQVIDNMTLRQVRVYTAELEGLKQIPNWPEMGTKAGRKWLESELEPIVNFVLRR